MTLKIREEAGLHLVTLLTTLQEAELALADPMAPGDESNKARKELDKLHGKYKFKFSNHIITVVSN